MTGVEIVFDFTVSDPESASLKVIESVVKDAQRKAEIIDAALGKMICEVSNINYGIPHDNYYDSRLYSHYIDIPVPFGLL